MSLKLGDWTKVCGQDARIVKIGGFGAVQPRTPITDNLEELDQVSNERWESDTGFYTRSLPVKNFMANSGPHVEIMQFLLDAFPWVHPEYDWQITWMKASTYGFDIVGKLGPNHQIGLCLQPSEGKFSLTLMAKNKDGSLRTLLLETLGLSKIDRIDMMGCVGVAQQEFLMDIENEPGLHFTPFKTTTPFRFLAPYNDAEIDPLELVEDSLIWMPPDSVSLYVPKNKGAVIDTADNHIIQTNLHGWFYFNLTLEQMNIFKERGLIVPDTNLKPTSAIPEG